jgi:hypothetical protein
VTTALGRVARVTLQQLRPVKGDAWFDRGYNSIAIEGLRVSFSSSRSRGAKPAPTTIRIYNLTERTRADLQVLPIVVLLEAGYATTGLRRIASGDLRSAHTTHEGPTVITTLEVADGDRAWRGASLDRGYRAGVPVVEVLRDAAAACGLSLPSAVAADPALRSQLAGGYAASGGALQQLERLLAGYGFEVSIEDGRLQVLRSGAARPGEAVVLRSGDLVGSPAVNSKRRLALKTPLDPRIAPGVLVALRSLELDGTYRVVTAKHDGDTHSGPWHTSVETILWI